MQTTPLEFAEVQKFRFDAHIQASDGEAGRLVSVIVDAERRTLTHAGIRTRAFSRTIYYVPLNLVISGDDDEVKLSLPRDEVEQKYTAVPYGEQLTRSTRVLANGKTLGRLAQLTITRETQALRHLVVDRGREALVPAERITSLSYKQIAVDLGGVSADTLTPYRRDDALYRDVYAAIYDYQPLRLDLQGVQIHAIDGTVWLKGHVASDLNRALIEEQLHGIHGLADVRNDLVADNELAADVSMALARDPRTARQPIGVYPQLGEIHLRGSVRTPEARQAAGEIAANVPGAGPVQDELHIDPRADVVPVLAGVTNEEDLVPGGS
ncbi:MAG TPA: BON domain-containing protein [Ktedonobacterales bacterium]|nr:BON domain-containing protein [Ktedonobacterales bacterium]